mmetsp:Transcript_26366/g.84873  ORF Transcript_26366/g.84873 Transcript_26366/m.84873 type:complete len:93 (-) Transcript_26366:1176-1454(-)
MSHLVPNPYSLIDNRFPNQNQALHCWALYNEFLMCRNANEGSVEQCATEKMKYKDICPSDWIEEWREMREDGVFSGVKDEFGVEEEEEEDDE